MERLRSCNKYKHENGLTSIFDACKEELQYFFGDEGFKELEKYRNEFVKDEISGTGSNPVLIEISQNLSGV
jgi:hypothetical protein